MGVALLGAGLLALGVVGRAERDEARDPAVPAGSPRSVAPVPTPPGVVPPGVAVSPGSSGPLLAMEGTIYTDKLFHGLLALDASPAPVTADQARAILRVIALLEDKLRKNQYYDNRLVDILSPDQLRFVEARVVGLTAGGMRQGFNPKAIEDVVAELESISGAARPTAELEVQGDVGGLSRPSTVSRMTSFMLVWPALQADPTVRVGREQAALLLPYVDAYVRLKSLAQHTKDDVLAVLTDAQKRWIDEHPRGEQGEISDMTRLALTVRTRMEERVEGAPSR